MNAWLIKTLYLSMTFSLESMVEPPVVPDTTPSELDRFQPAPQPFGNGFSERNLFLGNDPLQGHDTGHLDYTPPEGLGSTGFYRGSGRAIWNHAAVDGAGEFRPKILYVPGEGTYRSMDGKPMPQMRALPQFWNMGSPIE